MSGIKILKSNQLVDLDFNKLLSHCRRLIAKSPALDINEEQSFNLVRSSIQYIKPNISTDHINIKMAETASKKFTYIPDMYKLAGRLMVNVLHNVIPHKFSEVYQLPSVPCKPEFKRFIAENACELDAMIDPDRDHYYDYSSILTMIRSYLIRDNNKYDTRGIFGKTSALMIAETPQYMLLRMAVFTHMPDLPAIRQMYDDLSNKYYMHATPTMFNAGALCSQTASCFLLDMDDSLVNDQGSIFNTFYNIAAISKRAGGIGLNISKIRGAGALINSTQGLSSGVPQMLNVLDKIMLYVNQGGKRPGSAAVYIEPWHSDFMEFIDCFTKTPGSTQDVFHNLFAAVWVPDLFMEACINNRDWYMFSPDTAPMLARTWGKEFEMWYEHYKNAGVWFKKVPAIDIFDKICTFQIKAGVPYFLFKDRANMYSNQSRVDCISADTGMPDLIQRDGIVSSNLCAEIIERGEFEQYAVCNLASIILDKYIEIPSREARMDYILTGQHVNSTQLPHVNSTQLPHVNWTRLRKTVVSLVDNINALIDRCDYPVEECRNSNSHWRPIGIGVQGLADALIKMGLCFDESTDFCAKLMEFIYFTALTRSMEIARDTGRRVEEPMPTMYGVFKWQLALDGMRYYNSRSGSIKIPESISRRVADNAPESARDNPYNCPEAHCDWEQLRRDIIQHGQVNSLVLALMPTASTSVISGASECFEPISGISLVRKTLNGTFATVNSYVADDLKYLGLYNSGDEDIWVKIINDDNAFFNDPKIPDNIRRLYRTVYMYSQRSLCELQAVMSIYIDQSMSCNRYMDEYIHKLKSLHIHNYIYGGLITSSYYTRTTASARAKNPLYDIKSGKNNGTANNSGASNSSASNSAANNNSSGGCLVCE